MTHRHRTARERAAQQSAQTAIARAYAHTRPPEPEQPEEPERYPITPAIARQIRLQIEETRRNA